MSTAETSPLSLSPNQTLACDQQGYFNQPTVSLSDGNGINQIVSTNPEHKMQSVPNSNNAALYDTNTSSIFNLAVTVATITPVSFDFHTTYPSQQLQQRISSCWKLARYLQSILWTHPSCHFVTDTCKFNLRKSKLAIT